MFFESIVCYQSGHDIIQSYTCILTIFQTVLTTHPWRVLFVIVHNVFISMPIRHIEIN